MKKFLLLLTLLAAFVSNGVAATINWAAAIDNGLSVASGANLPAGSLVRLGYFRNPGSGIQLTDAQIQALVGSPVTLDASFVEVASTTIGTGLSPAAIGHFAVTSAVDTGTNGLNVEGKQMYLWVLNAATVAAATEHGVFYWINSDTSTNPDGTPETPGTRWSFPVQNPPTATDIDLTDLTTGTGTLTSGARVVIGIFASGTSSTTGAPNFALSPISTTILSSTPLPGGVLGAGYSRTLVAGGGTPPYVWSLGGGSLPTGLTLGSDGLLSGTTTVAGVFSFTAKVTDNVGGIATKVLSMTVASTALTLDTASPLAGGLRGLAYSAQLAASGGTPSYTWSVISGSVPSGLSLGSTGALSGTPTAAGVFGFTAQVADSGVLFATKAFSITIISPADTSAASAVTSGWATLNGTANPNGKTTTAYFQYGLGTGYGSTTYTMNLGSGTAPVPVGFNIAGLAPGTTYHYRLVVTNSDGTFYGVDQTFTTPATVSPGAWHSIRITANANMAPGTRTGVAHTSANLYYYKGTDQNVWAVYWNGTQWAQLQMTTAGNVDDWLVFHPAYNLVYYKGTDNNIWACYYTGTQWSQSKLTTNGKVAGDVIVDTVWNLAYYRGTDGNIWALGYSAGAGWGTASLGGIGNVAGSVSVDSAWHLIYYRTADKNLWTYYYPGTGAWTQVKLSTNANVGGSLTADAGGLVYYSSSVDGSTWGLFWNGAAWGQALLNGTAVMNGAPSLYGQYIPLYLTPGGQCRVMYVSGASWVNALLGDGSSGLIGGLGVLQANSWVFSGRNDGSVMLFYYQ